MQQGLSGMTPLVIMLVLGVVGGAILASFLLKYRIRAAIVEAQSGSQLEIARLTERITSVNSEVARQQAQIRELETKAAETGVQLDASKAQCAQLAERASRVAGLESQVSGLQVRVQGESARASTLAEQAARVPELQQSQQTALAEIQQLNNQIADLRQKWGASESTVESQRTAMERTVAERVELSAKRDQLLQDQDDLRTKLAEITTILTAEREQTREKLALLDTAKEQLTDTFKSLASEILEEKSIRFTEQNKTNIRQLLEPLGIKIKEFQVKVEEVTYRKAKIAARSANKLGSSCRLARAFLATPRASRMRLKDQAKRKAIGAKWF